MKKVLRAFAPFVTEITHDFMLAACILGPILIGIVFRFLVPELEELLCEAFSRASILQPYYIIFDLVSAIMTPILFCFAGVLVMLEESDCKVAKYFFVTPIGRGGYLGSRIVIPAFVGFFYDLILLSIFALSGIGIIMKLLLVLGGVLTAVITALIVVSFAGNKMEGMALIKLCSLLMIGIPIAYCVTGPIQYLVSILPSFWLAKLCITGQYSYSLPVILTSCILIAGMYLRFRHKLQG